MARPSRFPTGRLADGPHVEARGKTELFAFVPRGPALAAVREEGDPPHRRRARRRRRDHPRYEPGTSRDLRIDGLEACGDAPPLPGIICPAPRDRKSVV